MAKGKGSATKKEDKSGGNAKGKGKGKTGGKDEKNTDPNANKEVVEVNVRHILW
jgi:hypothetical protein